MAPDHRRNPRSPPVPFGPVGERAVTAPMRNATDIAATGATVYMRFDATLTQADQERLDALAAGAAGAVVMSLAARKLGQGSGTIDGDGGVVHAHKGSFGGHLADLPTHARLTANE